MSTILDSSIPARVMQLPPAVADCIAAGEVIERPASVVKELVENALDAGATEVQVTLESGGKGLIEVLDNGSGIYPEDLALCVSRHATSKLRSLEDLDHLFTLGFRGEALPSIVAVSDVSILSRSQNSEKTWEWKSLQGNSSPTVQPITFGNFLGSPHGTKVSSRNLFQNIPARLKFLKSESSEISHIREWMERLSLTHPQTGFRLIHDQKTVLQLRPKSVVERMKEILHAGSGVPVHEWENELGPVKLKVFWAQGMSLTHSRKIFQIVNGRSLKDKLLQSAVLAGFKQSLLPGNFPVLALKLEIPPQYLDVNVHPTKTEVRFLHSGAVFHAIESTLSEMVRAKGMLPHLGTERSPEDTQSQFSEPVSFRNFSGGFDPFNRSTDKKDVPLFTPHSESHSEQNSLATEAVGTLQNREPFGASRDFSQTQQNPLSLLPLSRYRGCLFDTYLLFELNSGELLLIDQHAAHERVRYEKLKKRFLKRLENPHSQNLLLPEVVEIESEHSHQIQSLLSILNGLGFDTESFGETQILFRSIPIEWGNENLKSRLRGLVDRFFENSVEQARGELLWDERNFEKLAMESCRSSIRAGDALSQPQIQALVEQLRQCEHPWNCPHGRPAMVRLPREKIEEWFQRKI